MKLASSPENLKIGILGGGQLGKMLIQAASPWSLHCVVLDPDPDCPAAPLANEFIKGSFNDFNSVLELGRKVDIVTIEIENVNTDALRVLQSEGKTVYPSPEVIETIKDKGKQKEFYRSKGIPTSKFALYPNRLSIERAVDDGSLKLPFVQKLCREGYDGRGVAVLRKREDLKNALEGQCVVEDMVDISKEIAVVLSRNPKGEVSNFEVVEMEFSEEANLVEMLIAPARIDQKMSKAAVDLAVEVISSLDHVGVMAVEMFVSRDGKLLVNEVAPRPHNSGHHTIESCATSQYEQHLRAILSLPVASCMQLSPAVMINILGAKNSSGKPKYECLLDVLSTEGAYLHIYGKKSTKPFRKMGHVTLCGNDIDQLIAKGRELKKVVEVSSL